MNISQFYPRPGQSVVIVRVCLFLSVSICEWNVLCSCSSLCECLLDSVKVVTHCADRQSSIFDVISLLFHFLFHQTIQAHQQLAWSACQQRCVAAWFFLLKLLCDVLRFKVCRQARTHFLPLTSLHSNSPINALIVDRFLSPILDRQSPESRNHGGVLVIHLLRVLARHDTASGCAIVFAHLLEWDRETQHAHLFDLPSLKMKCNILNQNWVLTLITPIVIRHTSLQLTRVSSTDYEAF